MRTVPAIHGLCHEPGRPWGACLPLSLLPGRRRAVARVTSARAADWRPAAAGHPNTIHHRSVRLNSIKLSGFKSFAEPTNFMLPGQLVGVVGPNGCGKSNIMDAVRWVLGESRASELRGESMQDVIFNGTNTRKPASRSSVELVFDNADHRAGGQWSQFTEIAVKRVLTRDGTSSYYINNQPVRRRDVQDVFLGTGLGPRAYAIIGQGTISRIIESKPEELRLFLEEAAGVSKYKERRRETENRLSDTRENLTRVEDILRELNANLEKLEKQAEVAQQYNALQSEVTLKQHQQWFLKRAESEADQAKVRADAEKSVNDLESRVADLRRIESDLETIRQAHYAAGDQVNQSQGHLYEASAEVGRLEAEIRFVVEGRQRVEQRLAQLKEQTAQWAARKDDASAEIESLAAQGVEAEEKAILLAAQVEEQSQQLPELEEGLRQAQARSAGQRGTVAQVQQQIQVLAADQRNIEEQSRQLNQRRESWRPTATRWPRRTKPASRTCRRSLPPPRKPPKPPMPACMSFRSRCPSSTTTGAAGNRPSIPRATSRRTCPRAWKRSRPCRKRSRLTASCAPGSRNTDSTGCRACGAASTSNRAGKARWKPPCANA